MSDSLHSDIIFGILPDFGHLDIYIFPHIISQLSGITEYLFSPSK